MSGAEVVLAVLGLIGPAISSCIKLCDFWMRAEGTGRDANIFKVRLDMQSARLKTWKLEWRIGTEEDLTKSHRLFRVYGQLAVRYLYLIHFLLNELQNAETNFSFLGAPSVTNRLKIVADVQTNQEWVQTMQITFDATNREAGLRGRIKWALKAPRAFTKRLMELKELIDDLTSFFRAPETLELAPTVLGTILPSNDRCLMQTLRSEDAFREDGYAGESGATDDGAIKNDEVEVDGNARTISALAWIREELLEMSERLSTPSPRPRVLPASRLKGVKNDIRNNRAQGQFEGKDVLIEWKTIPSQGKNAFAPIFEERIKDVAYLLRSDRKPAQFRTLDCLALVRELKPDGTTKYGLVYERKHPVSFSLRDILAQKQRQIPLGDRFLAAQSMAIALLYLQLASWVHKGIRSDNVLYFAPTPEFVNFNEPFLIGFDMSRPNKENEMTEVPRGELRFNLYRHPRVQGVPIDAANAAAEHSQNPAASRERFSVLHDMYSFGIILLELAECRCIEDLCREGKPDCFEGRFSPERMRRWLIEEKVPTLSSLMGQRYREATMICLTGELDLSQRNFESAFYLEVVRRLQQCQA